MRRADHPSRGNLPNLVCLSVILKPTGAVVPEARCMNNKFVIKTIVDFDRSSTLNIKTMVFD